MRPNIHETLERDEDPGRGTDRGFGLVMFVVFAIVAFWPFVFGDGSVRLWAIVISAAFLAVAAVTPRMLGPLNSAWLKLGLLLSHIVNPIVLGAMFYVVITPFGLLMRLFGKDPLRLRSDPTAPTYWIERTPPGPAPDSMRNQF